MSIYRTAFRSASGTGNVILTIPSPGVGSNLVIGRVHVADSGGSIARPIAFLTLNPIRFSNGDAIAMIIPDGPSIALATLKALGMDWPRDMRLQGDSSSDTGYELPVPDGSSCTIIYDNQKGDGNVSMHVFYRVA